MSWVSKLTEQLNIVNEYLWKNGKIGYAETVNHAKETIKELSAKLAATNMERSTAYYNGGWIPCNERMPEENDEYLVAWKPKTGESKRKCYIEIVEYENGEWIGDITQSIPLGGYDVFAWIPLPIQFECEEK